MATQPVSFDAPLKQPTTVSVPPPGVTFDGPLSSPTAVSLATSASQPAPGQQTPQGTSQPVQSKPAAQTGSMYAAPGSMPSDPLAAKLSLWAQNVQSDLMHGTDLTGVGHVLRAMGAHGLANGTSEGVARFMGSLPLGLLRATQGGAEIGQSGQRWRGAKDVAGGALEAGTIPASFIAPEAGEAAGSVIDTAAGKAADAALAQATKAAKSIREPFSLRAIQPKVQGAISSAIRDAAQEHGITIPDHLNVRDITQALSDALRQKASTLYKALDTATGGGRFQRFDEQLQNIQRAIKDVTGIDPDREGELIERWNSVYDARQAALTDAKAAGVDPRIIDQADALHRKSMALSDLSKAIRSSTEVHPSAAVDPYAGNDAARRLDQVITGQAGPKQAPANVKLPALFKRMQQLATPNPRYPGSPSRLVQALGEQRAAELLNAVDAAHLAAQKVLARNAWLKRGATGLGLYGLGRLAFDGAHSVLSNEQ